MNFLRLKAFLKLIINLEKEKHTVSHVAASGHATCHADVSTGSAFANIIMAIDDVSVDLVNVDQVNGPRPG